jgi:hypothetical protein
VETRINMKREQLAEEHDENGQNTLENPSVRNQGRAVAHKNVL